ncbi:MAG TPA: hypothetical protein DCP36_03885 [Sporomusaceae bacterium]|uniref:hypothetical protein n=1 Tax=Anaerospora sp. TaxID=1960278 RepID=UPI000ED79A4D|nr:hypothetical protein [Anaerospora sp.]HAK72931.1 hypothetical protein [Sporomusaceae bacterium]
MKKLIGLVLGVCFLYYLAYLPTFVFFVFIGQHIQSSLGVTEQVFITILNLLFASLLLLFIVWDNAKHRLH